MPATITRGEAYTLLRRTYPQLNMMNFDNLILNDELVMFKVGALWFTEVDNVYKIIRSWKEQEVYHNDTQVFDPLSTIVSVLKKELDTISCSMKTRHTHILSLFEMLDNCTEKEWFDIDSIAQTILYESCGTQEDVRRFHVFYRKYMKMKTGVIYDD